MLCQWTYELSTKLERIKREEMNALWKDAAEDPLIDIPSMSPVLERLAESTIADYSALCRKFSRIPNVRITPKDLACVADFMRRLNNNALGAHVICVNSTREIRGYISGKWDGSDHGPLFQNILQRIRKASLPRNGIVIGDEEFNMALIMVGMYDFPTSEQELIDLGTIGASQAAKEALRACSDFYWVNDPPALPWNQVEDAFRTESVDSTSLVLPYQAHEHLLKMPSLLDHIVELHWDECTYYILKDSARIIAPHACHSMLSGTDNKEELQARLLKLMMRTPGDGNAKVLDARSNEWDSTMSFEGIVNYFFDVSLKKSGSNLTLVLVVQYAHFSVHSTCNAIDNPEYDQSTVLALLKSESDANPATVFMSKFVVLSPNARHVIDFVKNAFLSCPLFRAHCALSKKRPAVFIPSL